jgi:hypothetical protein
VPRKSGRGWFHMKESAGRVWWVVLVSEGFPWTMEREKKFGPFSAPLLVIGWCRFSYPGPSLDLLSLLHLLKKT